LNGKKCDISFYRRPLLTEGKMENKAIEHYEKFLDLWNDAGSGYQEVSTLIEDAKKRLASLQ